MSRGRGIAALVLAALLGATAAEAAGPGERAAPDFRLRALDGTRLELEALRVKGPVLLDFWATWCKPCIAALPEIQRLHERHAAAGLTVIGVSEDGPRNFSKVRPFASRLGLRYPIALDEDGALQERYQVRALPTTVLIDRHGRVVRFLQGYRTGFAEELDAAIRELLPGGAGDAPADSAAADGTSPR